jgi:folate-dependent phosphoribosylglycinamide formyltransferase PurN
MSLKSLLPDTSSTLPRGALFVSGTGANAARILEVCQAAPEPLWEPACLVTDRPTTSRAAELAERFEVPLVSHDIRAFYQANGAKRISLADELGRRLRHEWTDQLRTLLAPHAVDFGILAGFLTLCNIAADFPCLNVHPGDLTIVDEDGQRVLVGHHTIPIEYAIELGHAGLRSSVIIVEPWEGSGGNMDAGLLLGVSAPVAIDFQGETRESLLSIAEERPAKRPPGGYRDRFEEIADDNLSSLKYGGDLVVFPQVVNAFVAGRYAVDDTGQLHYHNDDGWQAVQTVEFSVDTPPRPMEA